MKITKDYKPEIMTCPKCKAKLKYCYAVSAKTISFSAGRTYFIRNLGYKCPFCKERVYFSQTATKLALKGCRYSTKIFFMIYYYKQLKYSRERICQEFEERGITISERNVDVLYNKFLKLLNNDYTLVKEISYKKMLEAYQEIRLSIDLISYNRRRLIIIRDYFTADIIGFRTFPNIEDEGIIFFLKEYLSKDLPIGIIATIRKDEIFTPLLKQLVPDNTKFVPFLKI